MISQEPTALILLREFTLSRAKCLFFLVTRPRGKWLCSVKNGACKPFEITRKKISTSFLYLSDTYLTIQESIQQSGLY